MTIWEMHKKSVDGTTTIKKICVDGKSLILGQSRLTDLDNLRSFILHVDTYDWIFTKDGPFILMPETGYKNN